LGPDLFIHLRKTWSVIVPGALRQTGRRRTVSSSSSLFPLLLDMSWYLAKISFNVVRQQGLDIWSALRVLLSRGTSTMKISKLCHDGHNTHLSSPLFLTIVLANILEFDTARARCLSITSGAHTVAMIARSTHSPLDGCRASTFHLRHLYSRARGLHGGDCRVIEEETGVFVD
jgi:hypothetical protein